MNVYFQEEVREYFMELARILYEKEYFGYEESAMRYVDDLFDDIEETLPVRLRKPAPQSFDRYGKGMYYCVFKKNPRTKWYVFFNIGESEGETVYLVQYISNNHVIAHLL
ncbi:MAG: hypothetical protein LBE56_01280 [Tannerella sp.]|jgi:hypothetical protein|nr:hypothetical protein [Tannerella sp.]